MELKSEAIMWHRKTFNLLRQNQFAKTKL